MKKRLFLTAAFVMIAVLTFNFTTTTTSAHSIDYLAVAISPAASFSGNSGNFTVTDPVAGDSDISFNLTFKINTQGSTTSYPKTVTFGATSPSGGSVTISNSSCTFTSSDSQCVTSVSVIAPTTPGNYSFKIDPTSGTGGKDGLSSGGGVTVSFTVAQPSVPECDNAATALALSIANNGTVIYHATSTSFSAILTSGGIPVPGKTVVFSVGGVEVGTSDTDGNGVATFSDYDPSGLSAGNHSVDANFEGDECDYNGSKNTATLSVNYLFLGFQQPINADSSSIFSGKVVPVKIRITDAFGIPVPDAAAFLYFTQKTGVITGITGEQVASNIQGDSGNEMRYDPTAGQYIFNWNVGNLSTTPNGTYELRVYLGEGNTSDPHTVVLSLNRKK